MAKYKTLYHSGLIQNSPMHIQVTSDCVKSKYPKKDDGSGEFFVTLHFEGIEYAYTSENSSVAQFLGRFKGQNITIVATGKKEEATIERLGADGKVLESSKDSVQTNVNGPSTASSSPSATPTPSPDRNIAFKEALQRIMDAHLEIKQAVKLENEKAMLVGVVVKPEFFQAQCMSAFIYLDRKGLI